MKFRHNEPRKMQKCQLKLEKELNKFPWHLFRAYFNQGLLSPIIQQQEWTNAIQTSAKTKLSNHIYLYLAQIQSGTMARKNIELLIICSGK